MSTEPKNPRPRAVVAAVQLPNVSDAELESSLDELRELAKTLGFEVIATFTQKRGSFDATAYLGSGKREELKRFSSDRKSTRLNSSHVKRSRMPSSA